MNIQIFDFFNNSLNVTEEVKQWDDLSVRVKITALYTCAKKRNLPSVIIIRRTSPDHCWFRSFAQGFRCGCDAKGREIIIIFITVRLPLPNDGNKFIRAYVYHTSIYLSIYTYTYIQCTNIYISRYLRTSTSLAQLRYHRFSVSSCNNLRPSD